MSPAEGGDGEVGRLAVTAAAARWLPDTRVLDVDDPAGAPDGIEVLVATGAELPESPAALRAWRRRRVEVVVLDPVDTPRFRRRFHPRSTDLTSADPFLPAIDPAVANPIGWRRTSSASWTTVLHRPTAAAGVALAETDPDRWHVLVPAALPAAHRRETLGQRRAVRFHDDEDLVLRCKRAAVVISDPAWDDDAVGQLAAILHALAAGTPVVTTAASPAARSGLPVVAVDHADQLLDAAAPLVDDEDARERTSVAARRRVLTDHTVAAREASLRAELGLPDVRSVPRVSVLLATNRPDNVEQAVRSVASQDHPDVELVLLLHGDEPQPPAALDRFPGPVQVVRVPAERVLGEVLNAGLDVATGELVAKMDDDDVYGRHHLGDLVLALDYSGADLVGRRIEHVYLRDRDVTVTRQRSNVERDRDHVSGPTLLLPTDLARRYRFSPVPRQVDTTLLDRLGADGRRIYGTHALDVILHRHGEHTWQADEASWLEDAERIVPGLDLVATASTPDSYRAVAGGPDRSR